MSSDSALPAISLAALPGRRSAVLDLARRLDRAGVPGIYAPSMGDASLSLCLSIAHETEQIAVATAIEPIYRHLPQTLAATAAYLHEVSSGRFSLGLGVSHVPALGDLVERSSGKPLTDMREFVGALRAAEERSGPLPPVILATLRDRMLDLALETADGAVWANAARSHIGSQIARIPDHDFFVGCMIPTVVDADVDAARAVHRKTLWMYVRLPNYRNYWSAAGYADEMAEIEQAIAARDRDRVTAVMTDAWVDDVTLSGDATAIRDGVAAWRDAGVPTPILVPSSTSGGQAKAVAELLDALGVGE